MDLTKIESLEMEKILEKYHVIKKSIQSIQQEDTELRKKLMDGSMFKSSKELKTKIKLLDNYIEEKDKELNRLIMPYYHNLIIFPSDEKRFKEIMGYTVKPIDIGIPKKEIMLLHSEGRNDVTLGNIEYRSSILAHPIFLLEKKVIGIIEAKYSKMWSDQGVYSGLPIIRVHDTNKIQDD